jgi:hypothetical protein
MDEQDVVGEMDDGADGDFGLEVGQLWLIFVYSPNPLLFLLSMIHTDQMILLVLEPSIIMIWTYQDMME